MKTTDYSRRSCRISAVPAVILWTPGLDDCPNLSSKVFKRNNDCSTRLLGAQDFLQDTWLPRRVKLVRTPREAAAEVVPSKKVKPSTGGCGETCLKLCELVI